MGSCFRLLSRKCLKPFSFSMRPPCDTLLDRAALDEKMIDYVPPDVHVGSIAIQRFIEERQPGLTLHGHVHESARLTGQWQQRFGRTVALRQRRGTQRKE